MISQASKKQIIDIWDNYIASNREILDTKGNILEGIDSQRVKAIIQIKGIINDFFSAKTDVYQFKTYLDSYNKQNNLWGFTAVKGQMFFNQLVRNSDSNIDQFTNVLKSCIKEPKNLKDALEKIDILEKYCENIFLKAKDKRKAPNPKSVGYFLSYFWQIHNAEEWPVLFSSIIIAYTDLGIWTEPPTQKESYQLFFNLNEEIKDILKTHTGRKISNWDAEHSFWSFRKVTSTGGKSEKEKKTKAHSEEPQEEVVFKPNFELGDYLIPKVSRLIEIGNANDKPGSAKGSEFEKMVSEIFKLLDFEVDYLGQGTGRNPDAVIKFREENTAFIVDAKAYTGGYTLGVDDRAIKEYISHYCPKLIKDGYKKIGFIIVSNSFKSNIDVFINDITWNTDIKRFLLMTSEALLYLLAYKTKDKLTLSSIVESIIGFSNVITSQKVIEEFDDF